MKNVFRYLKGYTKECILGPLFKLLEAGFELFVPIVVAQIIDKAIPSADKGYAIKMSLVLIALGLVGFIAAAVAQFFAAKAACGFAKKLKHELFAHLQSLSHTELEKIGTSTMITRMTSDTNQLQTGVNMGLRLFLRSPFVVFGAMIMAFTIDVKSALVFTVIIPLLAIVVFAIILGCMPLYKKVQGRLDSVLRMTRENLAGVRIIRAFRLEKDEQKAFDESNDKLTGLQKLVGRISALMNPITYVILNMGIIALIYIGAIRVDAGIITQGAVFALYNYMLQILVELVKLANLIVTLTKAAACGNRVAAVFEITNSLADGDIFFQKSAPVTVEFNHASLKYYSAAEESLSDITFSAKSGETIGIIGATGSGKSTLVNLIPRFYDTMSGSVLINGVDVRKYHIESLRSVIGIVSQKSVLFHGTIRDNIKWGKADATDEEVLNALRIAQAEDFVLEKEGGLSAVIEQGGTNFSGGQRQRLSIARAIVMQPEILILDDSSSALDFATDAALRSAISHMEGDRITFIVSQRATSIMHSDRIVVLDDGCAVGIGTHAELLQSCHVYKEICDSQGSIKEEI